MPAPGDLIHQQSTSTGTGNITLSVVNGKRTFNDEFGTGGTDKFDYFISNQAAAEWERGTGHLSASTTLVRDTVLASSNANAAVSFSAGTKDIANDVPAALQVRGPGSATVGNIALWDSSAGNLLKDAGYAPRAVLTSNRTYYVRTDGSDANNGLSNASGGAFLTIQKAMDVVAALDISIYNATIQLGNTGTFAGCLLKAPVGSGTVIINGDTANPSNYTITKNGGSAYILDGQKAVGNFQISGVHPHDSTANYHIISGIAGNNIIANNNDYGDVINYPLASKYGGNLQPTGANNKLSCSGTITAPFLCDTNSNLIAPSATTFTWLRNIAFGQFVLARWGGILNLANLTCTLGAFSATGARYNADTNAVIITGGGGGNFFPGSTAGSTSNGGLYT